MAAEGAMTGIEWAAYGVVLIVLMIIMAVNVAINGHMREIHRLLVDEPYRQYKERESLEGWLFDFRHRFEKLDILHDINENIGKVDDRLIIILERLRAETPAIEEIGRTLGRIEDELRALDLKHQVGRGQGDE
jgi:hypothetical protein